MAHERAKAAYWIAKNVHGALTRRSAYAVVRAKLASRAGFLRLHATLCDGPGA